MSTWNLSSNAAFHYPIYPANVNLSVSLSLSSSLPSVKIKLKLFERERSYKLRFREALHAIHSIMLIALKKVIYLNGRNRGERTGRKLIEIKNTNCYIIVVHMNVNAK